MRSDVDGVLAIVEVFSLYLSIISWITTTPQIIYMCFFLGLFYKPANISPSSLAVADKTLLSVFQSLLSVLLLLALILSAAYTGL